MSCLITIISSLVASFFILSYPLIFVFIFSFDQYLLFCGRCPRCHDLSCGIWNTAWIRIRTSSWYANVIHLHASGRMTAKCACWCIVEHRACIAASRTDCVVDRLLIRRGNICLPGLFLPLAPPSSVLLFIINDARPTSFLALHLYSMRIRGRCECRSVCKKPWTSSPHRQVST